MSAPNLTISNHQSGQSGPNTADFIALARTLLPKLIDTPAARPDAETKNPAELLMRLAEVRDMPVLAEIAGQVAALRAERDALQQQLQAVQLLVLKWRGSADWMAGSTPPIGEWNAAAVGYMRRCADELAERIGMETK